MESFDIKSLLESIKESRYGPNSLQDGDLEVLEVKPRTIDP